MKNDPRREKERFLEEITAINLRRIWLIVLVSTGLSAGVFLCNLLLLKQRKMTGVETIDIVLSLVVIALVAVIRRHPVREWWRQAFVVGFIFLWLAIMDAYFFSALPVTGHNASYVIGVMSAAVFFLVRPAIFLPLLIVNHAIYGMLLMTSGGDYLKLILPPLVDGTVGVAIAGLASWILYHAARGNFFKERVIVQRNRALAATNAELREVMAIAAHDLQSPLFGVRDLLAIGRREPAAAEGSRLARILAQAQATCDGLAQLISRLVAAHAAEEKHMGLSLTLQDLRPGCLAAVEQLKATASAKGQRIELALPDEPVMAVCDRDKFVQVIENLLGNAVKFSPRDAVVEISLSVGSDICRVEVRDRGPGVPEEERAKLFQKFHRGSAQPTGGEGSTGLGLFIVKALTEAMGGNVTHAPRDGGGSVFVVDLPRAGQEISQTRSGR